MICFFLLYGYNRFTFIHFFIIRSLAEIKIFIVIVTKLVLCCLFLDNISGISPNLYIGVL